MLTPELPVTNKPLAPTGMRTSDARRRYRSQAQIVALLVAMGALLAYCGWIVAGWDGIVWSMIGGIVGLVLVRRMPAHMFLSAMRARPLLPGEAPGVQASFTTLCRRAGLSPIPLLYHIDEALPLAFSLGAGEAGRSSLPTAYWRGQPGASLAPSWHMRSFTCATATSCCNSSAWCSAGRRGC
jgi:hypothetical protein